MRFTARDFQDLVRALERRSEWKAELRRLLPAGELLALPEVARPAGVWRLLAGRAGTEPSSPA